MRLPLLATLFALNAIAAFVPIPAVGAASSNFSISNVTVQAGGDATFTVTRSTSGKGIYALVQTSDGSAHAGPDFGAVKQLLYFKGSETAKTVTVHTAVDQAAAGATLIFNIGVAAGAVDIAWGRGSIVEPAQPTPVSVGSNWIDGPLQQGGWAQATLTGGDNGWPKQGVWVNGQYVDAQGQPQHFTYENVYRAPVAGEAVYIMPASAGLSWDNRLTYTAKALSDGMWMIVYADGFKGLAPANGYVPPRICTATGWWTVNGSCTQAPNLTSPSVPAL